MSRMNLKIAQGMQRLGIEVRGGQSERGATDFLYALVVSIVPGLGQWIQRRRIYAYILFGSWLALLTLSVWSQWLLGLAISVQVTAIVDIYYGNRRAEVLVRVVFSLILFFALWAFVYAPVSTMVGRLAFREWVPASMALPGGDSWGVQALVAFRTTQEAARGDVIEYRQHGMNLGGDNQMHAVFMVADGVNVGYVAAVAGDRITFSGRKLLVNSVPHDYEGAGVAVMRLWPKELERFDTVVPVGAVFVIPDFTAMGPGFDAAAGAIIRSVCFVPREEVLGKGMLVLRPVRRARFL